MSPSIYKKFALIAEDNPSDVLIARYILEQEGLIPIIVDNGFEALEQIEKYPFAIILLDLQMPHMSGIDLMKRIRQNEAVNKIPILITSARNEQRDIKSAISLGATDYLIKPIDPMVFKTKLKSALTKDKSEWYEYTFEDDSLLNVAEVTLEFKIKAINELGCVLSTHHQLGVDETFTLSCPLLSQVEVPEILVRVVSSLPQGNESGRYDVSVLFIGLKEEARKKIRVFCRDVWLQNKKKLKQSSQEV